MNYFKVLLLTNMFFKLSKNNERKNKPASFKNNRLEMKVRFLLAILDERDSRILVASEKKKKIISRGLIKHVWKKYARV